MAEPLIEGGSGVSWPPPGLPHDACVFQLEANSKRPPFGYMGAHHRAKPIAEALLVPGPAASYGIRLDNQYLLVDFDVDTPKAQEIRASLPKTWSQRSKRGAHLLYRPPQNFVGGKNCDWVVDGTKLGQLKLKGYGVGLGSTVAGHIYTAIDTQDPAPAPQALLDYCLAAQAMPEPETLDSSREQIAYGERDDTMASIAGSLWNRNFSEGAVASMLYAISQSGVMEQPPGLTWDKKDALDVAQSAKRNFERKVSVGRVTPGLSAEDISLVGRDQEWLMEDFLQRGQLATLYGDGGCGKSTFGSWLAEQVTPHGLFVHMGIEEPFKLFARRAVAGGAIRSRLIPLMNPSGIILPACAVELEEYLGLHDVMCLWLDAVYAHFSPDDKRNAAERTRTIMGVLAEIAQRTNCTIVAGTHENKAGTYLGSTEMKNVARCLLHAKRNEGEPMHLIVEKANFKGPKVAATFVAQEVTALDPASGKIQYEWRKGKRVEVMDTICRRGPDVPTGKKGKGASSKVTGSVNLGDVEMDVSVAPE